MNIEKIYKIINDVINDNSSFEFVEENEYDKILHIRYEMVTSKRKSAYISEVIDFIRESIYSKTNLDEKKIDFNWWKDCQYFLPESDDCYVCLIVEIYNNEDDYETSDYEEWVEESVKMEYVYGDTVEVKGHIDGKIFGNEIGTVIGVNSSGEYLVNFLNRNDLHDGNDVSDEWSGKIMGSADDESGNLWWVKPIHMKQIDDTEEQDYEEWVEESYEKGEKFNANGGMKGIGLGNKIEYKGYTLKVGDKVKFVNGGGMTINGMILGEYYEILDFASIGSLDNVCIKVERSDRTSSHGTTRPSYFGEPMGERISFLVIGYFDFRHPIKGNDFEDLNFEEWVEEGIIKKYKDFI